MNHILPFNLPGPTAFYVTVYVLTLVIHVVFMNYVLAGSAYLAWVSVFTGGDKQRQRGPIAMILRDWMPLAISAAITAGVAPLLFIQILYQHRFYTANLLLFHRWMAILPILIVGFYLAYVLKSKRIAGWPAWGRLLVGVGAFACFAFTAVSWTENHLLSMESESTWTAFYASGTIIYRNPHLLPRLGIWFAGAFPTMALLVSWQLYDQQRRGRSAAAHDVRIAAAFTLLGMIVAGAFARVYLGMIDPVLRSTAITGPVAQPWLWAAAIGAAIAVLAWLTMILTGRLTLAPLLAASAGLLLSILGVTVVRESLRLAIVDVQALAPLHARSAQIGGLVVFLLFFAINAALVFWCIRMARKG